MKKLAALLLSLFSALAWSQGAPPNCPDTGGNHLNYTSATKSWACGTSSSSSLAIGESIGSGTATRVLFEGAGPVLADDANFTFNSTTNSLSVDVVRVLDGSSTAASYAGPNAGSGIYFSGNDVRIATNGVQAFNISSTAFAASQANSAIRTTGTLGNISTGTIGFGSNTTVLTAFDSAFSRISAGIIGVGTGAAASIAGGMQMASIGFNSGKVAVSATAPTIASGGCTSPTVTNTNGTAYITIDVGTSCSGSQPVVFTLPAATTGWNCYARNVTNGATSAPAQTDAVSTTSITITNFDRTTGLAAAWTDGDDVVVSCLGG